jgi:hypothetical protein
MDIVKLHPALKDMICNREESLKVMKIVSEFRKGMTPTKEEIALVFKYAAWTFTKTAAIMDILAENVEAYDADNDGGSILGQLLSGLGKGKKQRPNKPTPQDIKSAHGKDLADIFSKLMTDDEDPNTETAGSQFSMKSMLHIQRQPDGSSKYKVSYSRKDPSSGSVTHHEVTCGSLGEAMEKTIALMLDPTVCEIEKD